MNDQITTVEGVVERILFVSSNGYTGLRLALANGTSITAKGEKLHGTQPGETLRITGRTSHHPAYGTQLHAENCRYTEPATIHAIRTYLSSGLVKGIGPRLAEAIVTAFKEETLQIIDTTPHRLLDVPLIGPTRYTEIVTSWQQHQEIRQLMILLQSAGIPTTHAPRIARHFRTEQRHSEDATDILGIIRDNPYRLTEVYRIGFKLADKLALWLGLPEQSPQRLQAALLHTLETAALREGHCFLYERQLYARTTKILGDRNLADLLPAQLAFLRVRQRVTVQPLLDGDHRSTAVFAPQLHAAEISIARRLAGLRSVRTFLTRMGEWRTAPLLPADSITMLASAQDAAVRMALSEPVSVLTGGPGCGKSFTVKTIVDIAEASGAQVSLAAPTGRAAKRLSELTGRTATTIHRLIAKRPQDDRTRSPLEAHDPLDAELIVIDEASMLDLALFERLLGKVAPGTHLLLVGDVHQLPSVAAGQVLRDLLAVPGIPRTVLTEVFRQGEGSAITTNAHRINAGQSVHSTNDFWFIEVPGAHDVPAAVLDIVTRRLPAAYGITPGDIQILAPSTKGPAGTRELNLALQNAINPHRKGEPQHWHDGRPFRPHDRLIAVRNDPRKGILNGTTGTVTTLDTDERQLHLALDDGDTAAYGFDELDELLHAYAITVHRAQGSEYPFVVVPLTTTGPAYLLLRRNLLYTAVTRARRMLILVGDESALATAIRQPATPRNTTLAARIHAALTGTVVLPYPVRPYDGQAALL
ncbi:ATP-dependent RecD-like DNA helicase [Kitasatospora sp. NPDC089509]|uniref:SF1B family DNA helicase RecD2 n=1 Tax=Kitasatospora sp. NPDC089509 TaxID=3364079 RepID=UPI0038265FAA